MTHLSFQLFTPWTERSRQKEQQTISECQGECWLLALCLLTPLGIVSSLVWEVRGPQVAGTASPVGRGHGGVGLSPSLEPAATPPGVQDFKMLPLTPFLASPFTSRLWSPKGIVSCKTYGGKGMVGM